MISKYFRTVLIIPQKIWRLQSEKYSKVWMDIFLIIKPFLGCKTESLGRNGELREMGSEIALGNEGVK